MKAPIAPTVAKGKGREKSKPRPVYSKAGFFSSKRNTQRIFMSTSSRSIVPAHTFLSGDILTKLQQAQSAKSSDASFQKEMEALGSVLPEPVPIELIDIRIGATWIPLSYYEDFCLEVFGERTKFFYSTVTGAWDVKIITNGMGQENEMHGFRWIDEKGDVRWYRAIAENPLEGLFTMALFFKTPKMRDQETEAAKAIAKQDSLHQLFSNWCKEGDRGEELQNFYNSLMNRVVLPNWDDSGQHLRPHLIASGMTEEWANKLRPYQLDAIWRMCIAGNTLLGLEVGLGKTQCLIAACMLRKYYKTCRKVLFAVQRSTLLQIYSTFKELYPKAKVLCATPEDCSAGNRQRLIAKAVFWEWDAIILTHESFNKLPVRLATEANYIDRKLEIIEDELNELFSHGELPTRKGRGNRVVKQLELARNVAKDRLGVLNERHDVGIHFEDIGIDLLIIDEAQKYKNAFVATKLQVKGLSKSTSARAEDLELKLGYLRSLHGAGYLIMSTGTPEPTNSILGIYVFQRYLQMSALEDRGLVHFDSWAANFGRVVTSHEFHVGDGIRATDRFSEFVNLPELLRMWLEVVHIKRKGDVAGQGNFECPGVKQKVVRCDLSEWQLAKLDEIRERYLLAKKGNPVKFLAKDVDGCLLNKKGKRLVHPISGEPVLTTEMAGQLEIEPKSITDGNLKLYSESRLMMVCPQLIDSSVPVKEGDKIAQVVRRIYRWWKLTEDKRSVQLVFLSVGTPGGSAKFPIYEWMKDRLVERGIPSDEVAFIQDFSGDEKKAALFDKVNAGEVRVVIGSTEPMGIGVNVQRKIKVMHMVDIPVRPDQYEQQLGRGIRYGNENEQVLVYQYLTRGRNGRFGANALEFQQLEQKSRRQESIRRADPTVRRLVENDEASAIYLMLKAESCGDERIMEHERCKAEVDKNKTRAALNIADINRISFNIKVCRRQIEILGSELDSIEADATLAKDWGQESQVFACEVDGVQYFGADFVPREKIKFKPRFACKVLSTSTPIAIAISVLAIPMVKQAQTAADKHIHQKVHAIMLTFGKNGDSHRIGIYAGFEIWVRIQGFCDRTLTTLWLKGSVAKKTFDFRVSELRLIRNMTAAVKAIASMADESRQLLARQQVLLNKYQANLVAQREEKDVINTQLQEMELKRRELEVALRLDTLD